MPALSENELELLVALVAAVAVVVSALVTSVIGVYLKKRADRELERLRTEQSQAIEKIKTDLSHENRIRGARLDYEYDAKKRLYSEVEPLLFSAHLAATSLKSRFLSFADRVAEGRVSLDPTKTWMRDGYFQQSCAYRLFLPSVHRRFLARRISQFDLSLEPEIGRKFMALSVPSGIFPDHFDLARVDGAEIAYEPYAENVSEKDREEEPGRYTFQGLYRGNVERFVSAMTEVSAKGARPLEWFEFEQALADPASDLSKAYAPVRDLLTNFHPCSRPVFWRALVAHVLTAEFFTRSRANTLKEYDACIDRLGWEPFDFCSKAVVPVGNLDAAKGHFEAAKKYVRRSLGEQYDVLGSASHSQ